MQTLATFDAICQALRGAKLVIQWGGSHVYKIGGKVFAIGNLAGETSFVFKATPLSYEILLEQGLASRAPYLTRGNWLRVGGETTMTDAELAGYLQQSYQMIVARLTKDKRRSLGLG